MNHRSSLLAALVALACAEPRRVPMVELNRSTVIAGVDDSVDVTFGQPAISSNGFIAVRRLEPPADAIAIYDSSGTYVHTVGRAGGGPGEFQSLVSFAFGPGDSLWAFADLTAHVFAPQPSQQFVRSFRFDGFVVPVVTALG